jgi:putative FmdB family regulatory protein
MPIYNYKCPKCQKTETVHQKMDEPPVKCASCDCECERVPSRTSFVLSGGGWYRQGYSK